MNSQHLPKGTTCIVGFDSAWTDNVPGAVCALVIANNGPVSFKRPYLASFDEAFKFIEDERRACAMCLVALDQPTIVQNETGSRPVDRVAASLVSFIGGGVQPANRSKKKMFGDGAPIWCFKKSLRAIEKPELSRTAESGLFIIEVFPALALPALNPSFNGRCKAPKYNPANKARFRSDDWYAVIETVEQYARNNSIREIEHWARDFGRETTGKERPRKEEQDLLDAVLCALIGYHWRAKPREESIMIGDEETGYMIAPTDEATRTRLKKAASERDVLAV